MKAEVGCKRRSSYFFRTDCLIQVKNYQLTRGRENEGGLAEGIWDWLSGHVKTNSIFCPFWSLRFSFNGWEVTFLMQCCRKSKILRVETLKEELKAIVLEENDFENRVELKLSECRNFWRFQFHDFNAGSGLIVFLPNFSPRVETFWLRPLLE